MFRSKSWRIAAVAATLIVTGLSFYLRSSNQELMSDDLLYGFVLDDQPLGQNADYTRPVLSLSDAVESQRNQWFGSNGRFIVHVLVQMFAGPWHTAFPLANTLFFLSAIIMTGFLAFPKSRKLNPWLWLLLCIAFLYLFQNFSAIFYSVAGGMNYVYPMALMSGFMLLFKRWQNCSITTWYEISLAVIAGFLAGQCQECFSLPLSAGVFFWLIANRKRLTPTIIIAALALFLGTATLVLAPGNFGRLSNSSIGMSLQKAVGYFADTWILWIALILAAVTVLHNRSHFNSVVKDYFIPSVALVTACLFGCVANTLPQSFSGISFYSMVMAFAFFSRVEIRNKINSYVSAGVFATVLGILCFHQSVMVEAHALRAETNRQFKAEVMLSKADCFRAPLLQFPKYARPFIGNWFQGPTYDWEMKVLGNVFYNGQKTLTLLRGIDAEAYFNPETFENQAVTIGGGITAWAGRDYIWFKKGAVQDCDTLVCRFSPGENWRTVSRRFYRSLRGVEQVDESCVKEGVDMEQAVVGDRLVGVPYPFSSKGAKDLTVSKL